MTPHDRIMLGDRAAALMSDPAYAAAVAKYEAELFTRWKAATDLQTREDLWHECQALAGVTGRLSALRTDGAVVKSRT